MLQDIRLTISLSYLINYEIERKGNRFKTHVCFNVKSVVDLVLTNFNAHEKLVLLKMTVV